MTRTVTMFGILAYLNNPIHCYTCNKLGEICKQRPDIYVSNVFRAIIIVVNNDENC